MFIRLLTRYQKGGESREADNHYIHIPICLKLNKNDIK